MELKRSEARGADCPSGETRGPRGNRTPLLSAARDVFFWLCVTAEGSFFNRFDREHGTDTRGTARRKQLGILQPLARHGVRYQPIHPGLFRRAIRTLLPEVVPSRFTFVDLGCGKGRALILAGEFGFGDLVGVDVAGGLVESARRNLAKAAVRNARAVCQSADTFRFPAGDLVVYLFNPFGGPVFRRTLTNLCRTASGILWLLYVNPVEGPVLNEMSCFKPWRTEASFSIYRHFPHVRG